MKDFLAALGLFFVLEGLISAAWPEFFKRAMVSVLQTPSQHLRLIGIGAAIFGIVLLWFVRG